MNSSSQKQLGSYYTGADITEYIGTATILPCICAMAERRCPAAFVHGSPLWSLPRDDPDRYIYRALRHGCALTLPPEIAAGLHTPSLRGAWNRPAPSAYALPLESWREVVARRQRYTELRARLKSGEICSLDDLITCNLDLRSFVVEAVRCCSEPELLDAFYTSVERVSILDPTCGQGAFLLAALRVLEPLYAACLEQMQRFLEEQTWRVEASRPDDRSASSISARFSAILREAGAYPERRHIIRKTIIERNLYGVDIMPESIECCKQRLLLEVCTQAGAEERAEIEQALARHLRVGNALVGFTRSADLDASLLPESDPTSWHTRLDEALAVESDVDRLSAGEVYAEKLAEWRSRCRPFHWCIEFREILSGGGFDVIIGNPPYVVYKKVQSSYQVRNYETQSCGNLYAYTLERALTLLRPGGRCGMIVPVSAISGESFRSLIQLLLRRQVWISSYSNRPGKLFADVEQRLAILLVNNVQPPALFSSPYQHWYAPERAHLFDTLIYAPSSTWPQTGMPLKSGSTLAESIFARLLRQANSPLLAYQQAERAEAAVWVHDGPTYWIRALPFEPNVGRGKARSNHYHKVPLASQRDAFLLAAVLSSSTFYLFYKLVSNCRDLGLKELHYFPLGHVRPELADRLVRLGCLLAQRLQETAEQRSRRYVSGTIVYEEYYPARARSLLDEIDRVLAEHYGFSEEELDFILNYEIKYRVGRADRPC